MDRSRDGRTPALPFIKIGRSVHYLRENLDTWLDTFQRLTPLAESKLALLSLGVNAKYLHRVIKRSHGVSKHFQYL